jgi:hypothetical protein
MMNLREVVERYQMLATNSGEPVPLEAFGLSPEETVDLFTALDEDYHISRYLNFSLMQGRQYSISDKPATHVQIDKDIQSLL